jgi:hypothetical protein
MSEKLTADDVYVLLLLGVYPESVRAIARELGGRARPSCWTSHIQDQPLQRRSDIVPAAREHVRHRRPVVRVGVAVFVSKTVAFEHAIPQRLDHAQVKRVAATVSSNVSDGTRENQSDSLLSGHGSREHLVRLEVHRIRPMMEASTACESVLVRERFE